MMSTVWSFLMLLVVVALIPLTLWLLKRVQNFRPGGVPRDMEIMAQVALGPRERMVCVRLRGREFVLGVTPQQVSLLAELHAGSERVGPS